MADVRNDSDVDKSANKARIVALRDKRDEGTMTDPEAAELKTLERQANDEVNDPPTPGN